MCTVHLRRDHLDPGRPGRCPDWVSARAPVAVIARARPLTSGWTPLETRAGSFTASSACSCELLLVLELILSSQARTWPRRSRPRRVRNRSPHLEQDGSADVAERAGTVTRRTARDSRRSSPRRARASTCPVRSTLTSSPASSTKSAPAPTSAPISPARSRCRRTHC